jgi:hypothetical protein
MRIWPEERLRDEIEASGPLERPVADLLRDFGVQRPGDASRRLTDQRLLEAGIHAQPSLEEAGLGSSVRLSLEDAREEAASLESERRKAADAEVGRPSSGDFEGGTGVCPRCGEPAAEHQYCPTCGLHLLGESELSARTDWRASRLDVARTVALVGIFVTFAQGVAWLLADTLGAAGVSSIGIGFLLTSGVLLGAAAVAGLLRRSR